MGGPRQDNKRENSEVKLDYKVTDSREVAIDIKYGQKVKDNEDLLIFNRKRDVISETTWKVIISIMNI